VPNVALPAGHCFIQTAAGQRPIPAGLGEVTAQAGFTEPPLTVSSTSQIPNLNATTQTCSYAAQTFSDG
jgi:hypothetical protein